MCVRTKCNSLLKEVTIVFCVHGNIMNACKHYVHEKDWKQWCIFPSVYFSFVSRNVLSRQCKPSALSRNCLLCHSNSRIPLGKFVVEIQITHRFVVMVTQPLKHSDCTFATDIKVRYTSYAALNCTKHNHRPIRALPSIKLLLSERQSLAGCCRELHFQTISHRKIFICG